MTVQGNKNFLYLIWKDPVSRRNYTVGKLTKDDLYHFCYCEEWSDAKAAGWTGLHAFPEEKEFTSETLFPVFSSRLPDPKRRDISRILEKYGLKQYDPFELLKRNGGRLPIDTYEFINPIFPDEVAIHQSFFVMGIRHYSACNGEACSLLPTLSVGTELVLHPEPTNKEDKNAVQIKTLDGVLLGYIPRYYNKPVLTRLNAGTTYCCKVIEFNGCLPCCECIKVDLTMPRIE